MRIYLSSIRIYAIATRIFVLLLQIQNLLTDDYVNNVMNMIVLLQLCVCIFYKFKRRANVDTHNACTVQ